METYGLVGTEFQFATMTKFWSCPASVAQSAYEPKCRWFDSQTGHMPGLQSRSPVGGVR